MRHDARPAARLTVIAASSGVGVMSVVELIRARSPLLWLSVPLTTRPRRPTEIDGVSRRFVDRGEFERLRDGGHLLEWTQVAGNLYGTDRNEVWSRLRAGRPVLMCTDPAGARQVRAAMPQARLVLLAAPGRDGPGVGIPGVGIPGVDGPGGDGPDYDTVVVNHLAERAAGELVDFVGCSIG
nr:guanylate kinase [Micromonospora sp. DSM 115978]